MKISFAGAGENISEAQKPALIEDKELGVGNVMVTSFADHGCNQVDSKGDDLWAASDRSPGLSFLNIELMSESDMVFYARGLHSKKVESNAGYSIVSCHWGSNWDWKVKDAMVGYIYEYMYIYKYKYKSIYAYFI
jgi:hypothetical protein